METLSAGVAGAEAAVAEFAGAGAASFDSGAAEEGAADEFVALAPVPNCPARNTCAALASFDLMSCAGSGFVWGVDGVAAEGVADDADDGDGDDDDDDDGVDGDDATGETAKALPPTGAELAAPLIRTLTAKLPLQSGVACEFTPKNRWPGVFAVSRRLLPTGTASPWACSLAIRDPSGAAATGRPALAWAEPLAPLGSQGSAEDASVPAAPGAGAALISRASPACRSTPVSVQGWVVEMVKEYSLGVDRASDSAARLRVARNATERAIRIFIREENFIVLSN